MPRLLPWALACCLCALGPQAAGDLTRQTPIDLTIELGDTDDRLRFFPDHLEFEAGRLYRITLHNPSPQPHYFTSPDFAGAIYTRKALALGPDGRRIGEFKGMVLEVEVYPGGTVEWWFIPVRTISMRKFVCNITGHAEAGMVGMITIR